MINGLYDGVMTRELDRFSIQTSALLTVEEPPYAKLATQPLVTSIDKEVRSQDIYAFTHSMGLMSAVEWRSSWHEHRSRAGMGNDAGDITARGLAQ